jgi:hypothetical protein
MSREMHGLRRAFYTSLSSIEAATIGTNSLLACSHPKTRVDLLDNCYRLSRMSGTWLR